MTASATSQSSTFTSPDDPIFSQPSTDYALLDADGNLAERYRHLQPSTQQFILAEHALGRTANALRVANCWTSGTVYEICENDDFVRAHPNLCHDDGCLCCGLAYSQMWTWTGNRDREKLFHDDNQFGIELTIPGVTGRKGRNRMFKSYKKFILVISDGEETSTQSHDVVEVADRSRRRIAVHACTWRWTKLNAAWKVIEPTGTLTVHRNMAARETLTWTFLGAEPLLALDGGSRSMILAAFRNSRLSRTTGEFYRPLSKLQLLARAERRKSDPSTCQCPRCKGKILSIPEEKRFSQPIDTLNDRYCVDWSAQDPFYQRRPKPIANRALAISMGHSYGLSAAPTHSPPS